MSNGAVIGLGFGDEGKGVVTDYLCSQDPKDTLVVRFSGGQQCGHKVIKDNIEHIFSNFGSGTLRGCPTYWSKYCTFEPVGFYKEYSILQEKGITPKIYINSMCPVTTPYDIFINQNSIEMEHGTTGTGFYRTKKRHIEDGIYFDVYDFLLPYSVVESKLNNIKSYYNLFEELDLSLFYNARKAISRLWDIGVIDFISKHPKYENIVFEGSQGLMLDEKLGYFPHVTPSDLTPRNILKMGYEINEIYLISRAYQTRHGNGLMTNDGYIPSLINTEKETNIYHKYQGEFRTSMLDLDQLIYAKTGCINMVVPKSIKVNLVITCIDQLSIYHVTHGHTIFNFDDAKNFVRFIGEKLNINGDLYINDSPYSNTIRKI